jgi:hypothetical protein
MDILPFLQTQETALIKAFDANDWIYRPGRTTGTISARRPA